MLVRETSDRVRDDSMEGMSDQDGMGLYFQCIVLEFVLLEKAESRYSLPLMPKA